MLEHRDRVGAESDDARACPACGQRGAAVQLQTVKALLTDIALRRIQPTRYRFCGTATCDVVYFGEAGDCFGTLHLRTPVLQKQVPGSRLLCYCFGETESGIRAELVQSRQTDVVHRIREHIAAERCACDIRNPRGACCLGDVIAAVNRIIVEIAEERRTMESSRTYRIGEIAQQTGVSVETLRYYEKRRLLKAPLRAEGGFRMYSNDAVQQVKFIKQAQTLGLTLDDVQQLLTGRQGRPNVASCRKVSDLLTRRIEDIDARIKELRDFRRTLNGHLVACQQALAARADPACPTIEALDHSKRASEAHEAR
jgi:DNA-binding transcriptional MerR regulator